MKKLLILPLVALVSVTARAELRLLGKVYDEKAPRTAPVYDFKNELVKSAEEQISTSTFSKTDGTTEAIEVTRFDGTGRLRSYSLDEKQEHFLGTIDLKDGKAKFSFTQNGKTKTNEEEAGDDFIVGSMIPEDLQRNWSKLQNGEKLKRRLAVVDRRETIGFELTKESETELNGKKVVVIKMRPTNFLIAAIVKPIHFYVTADGKELLEFHGRTIIKKQVGDDWKDLDAITVYTQVSAHVAGGNSK